MAGDHQPESSGTADDYRLVVRRDTVAFTAADIREGSIDRLLDFNPATDKLDLSGMRSLLTGRNANLSWSEMFIDRL